MLRAGLDTGRTRPTGAKLSRAKRVLRAGLEPARPYRAPLSESGVYSSSIHLSEIAVPPDRVARSPPACETGVLLLNQGGAWGSGPDSNRRPADQENNPSAARERARDRKTVFSCSTTELPEPSQVAGESNPTRSDLETRLVPGPRPIRTAGGTRTLAVSVRTAASHPWNGGAVIRARGWNRTIQLFRVGEALGHRASRAEAGKWRSRRAGSRLRRDGLAAARIPDHQELRPAETRRTIKQNAGEAVHLGRRTRTC